MTSKGASRKTKITKATLKQENIFKGDEQDGLQDSTFSIYDGKKVPAHFNMTRGIVQYDLTHGEENYRKLTTITEETPAKYIDELQKIGKNVSRVMIKQVTMALGKELYNTSYQMNNTQNGTGLATDKLSDGTATPVMWYKGQSSYIGEIRVKISDLVADVYGVEKVDNKQKKEVLSTLHAMEGVFIEDGEGNGAKMLSVGGYTIDKTTKARIYRIFLHPLFAINIQNNFASHPQNIMKLLKGTGRITEAKLNLLDLLSLQRKDKPFIIYQSDLLEKIGLSEAAAKDKTRTLKGLQQHIEAMLKIGILKKLPTIIKDGKGEAGDKYTFTLNPSYVKQNHKKRSSKSTEENEA